MPTKSRPDPSAAPAGAARPVTLVLGDEELLAERAVTAAVETARDALGPGTEVERFNAASLPDGFALGLATTSLFGGGRVVVVDDAQDLDAKARAAVLAAVEDPAPGTCLVLRAPAVGRQAKFFTAVQKHAHVVKTPKLKPAERIRFVKSEVKAAGRTADDRAVTTLLDLVGSDLRELAGAVAKLHVAVPPPAPITAADVAENLADTAERGIFEFTDAVIGGDAAAALTSMDSLLSQGENEVRLMGMLAGQVRRLVQVSAQPGASDARVAEQLGLREWQVRNARRAARRFRPEQLHRAMALIAESDAELRTGALPQRLRLELLVARIAGA